ncbi:hypothetical protein ACHAXS_008383 [Conticribra weissflogii]
MNFQHLNSGGFQAARRQSMPLLNEPLKVNEEYYSFLPNKHHCAKYEVDTDSDSGSRAGISLYVPSKSIAAMLRSSTRSSMSDITSGTFPSIVDGFANNINIAPAASRRRSSQLSQAVDSIFARKHSFRRSSSASFGSVVDPSFGKRDSLLLASLRGVSKRNVCRDLDDASIDSSVGSIGSFLARNRRDSKGKEYEDFDKFLISYERRDSLFITQRRLRGESVDVYDESDDDDEEYDGDDLIVSWRTD